jgi:7-cyano-7-deazaguanine synthase
MKHKIGVVLLSGGLDSTTTVALAKNEGYEVHALTVKYGQKLSKEVGCARKVAEKLRVSHKVIDISAFKDIAWYSALTRPEFFRVPKGRSIEEMTKEIPITYVPMRNTFFVVLAAANLESVVLHKIETEKIEPSEIEARIFIAANYLDYSGYPDCRPEFFVKMNELMSLASKVGTEYGIEMRIETPLLRLGKKEIAELGSRLEAPLEWTWSCYEGGNIPCGKCDSCLLRAKGFREAEIEDPLILRLKKEGKM